MKFIHRGWLLLESHQPSEGHPGLSLLSNRPNCQKSAAWAIRTENQASSSVFMVRFNLSFVEFYFLPLHYPVAFFFFGLVIYLPWVWWLSSFFFFFWEAALKAAASDCWGIPFQMGWNGIFFEPKAKKGQRLFLFKDRRSVCDSTQWCHPKNERVVSPPISPCFLFSTPSAYHNHILFFSFFFAAFHRQVVFATTWWSPLSSCWWVWIKICCCAVTG